MTVITLNSEVCEIDKGSEILNFSYSNPLEGSLEKISYSNLICFGESIFKSNVLLVIKFMKEDKYWSL